MLACGTYRSGSTLQYNLVAEYLERANLGRRLGFVEPEQARVLPEVWSFVEGMGWAVAKCHLAPSAGDDNVVWRRLIGEGRVTPVCTVRDWRDVVASFARKFDETPTEVLRSRRWALNLANLESWLHEGALLQRYEELTTDPEASLRALLGHLDLSSHPALVADAAHAAGPARRTNGTSHLGKGAADPRTLLHWDHVATPEGGGWRDWPSDERRRVEEAVAPLMARFGYDLSPPDAPARPPTIDSDAD